MIKLFKAENCQACKSLQAELIKRGIPFEEETDVNIARELGIRSAPALIVDEATVLRSPAEIIKFLKAA